MNNVTAFSDRLYTAINTPQCDILTGTFIGGYTLVKLLFGLVIIYITLRFIEKLAFEPFLDWCKKKLYKNK